MQRDFHNLIAFHVNSRAHRRTLSCISKRDRRRDERPSLSAYETRLAESSLTCRVNSKSANTVPIKITIFDIVLNSLAEYTLRSKASLEDFETVLRIVSERLLEFLTAHHNERAFTKALQFNHKAS
ncbi:hypothetical protein EVAR_45449_1 [Eumeta japonica]|uniref:Uncharacterized protein n=1 Tax=Eumeta variegata TaxID=151549 RepID=A0A4C1YKS7_EUMVA|nr:hypothetical protein EVAR_45449_1 [Eumeta japonica]